MAELTAPAPVVPDPALASVAAYGLSGARIAPPAVPLDADRWSAFLDAVASERLAGMLGAAIESGTFPATDRQIDEAASLQTDVAVVALLLERLLLALADQFAGAGLELRVLKGPSVAHLDYPEPSVRAFGDLDLLVRAGDFTRAVELLEASGGHRRVPELRRGFDERFGKSATITLPGELEVDLHRTFVAGPLGMTMDPADVFERSAPFVLGGRSLSALGTEERFLHACIHAGLDRPARLHSLRDVAQMTLRADLDVDRVHRLARSWRARAVVARAVTLAWTTLELADSVALSVWAERYRANADERKMLDAYLGGDRSFTRQALATIAVIPRRRDKVAYARSLLFPQRRYLDARRDSRLAHVRHGAAHLQWGIPR